MWHASVRRRQYNHQLHRHMVDVVRKMRKLPSDPLEVEVTMRLDYVIKSDDEQTFCDVCEQ